MVFLRFLMLLSLVVWLGAILFFAVLAPTTFSILPTRHLAGSVVGAMLSKLHWMGIIAGIVFLASSTIYSRLSTGDARLFGIRHILLCAMLVLTLVSQFGISPKMTTLRRSMGEIDAVPMTDPARVQFNALHMWSTRLEIGVLVLGLAVLYITAHNFA